MTTKRNERHRKIIIRAGLNSNELGNNSMLNVINAENEELRTLAVAALRRQVAENRLIAHTKNDVGDIWRSLQAGCFITVYGEMPPISENVWCCMSNGEYDGRQSAAQNVVESAQVCASRDSRRHRFEKEPRFETDTDVTLLAPRDLWIHLGAPSKAVKVMQRSKGRSFYVQTSHSAGAVYLPSVWNEQKDWTAGDLLRNLTQKAGRDKNTDDDGGAEPQVFEIASYTIEPSAFAQYGHYRRDRGFCASLILGKALRFYEQYRRNNQLAYSVAAETDSAPGSGKAVYDNGSKAVYDNGSKAVYDNDGAHVRSYADVVAYYKLAYLLNKNTAVVDTIAKHALENFPVNSGATAAAHVDLFLTVLQKNQIDSSAAQTFARRLLQYFPSADYAFENPQMVLALGRLYSSLPHDLQRQIEQKCVQPFVANKADISRAFEEHGAFAANWFLQALAQLRRVAPPQLTRNLATLEQKAIQLCNKAILRYPPSSITEQACAAHGLLAVEKFDVEKNDLLADTWLRYQHRWKNGGFRYHLDIKEQRTDVTSHVVEVCLLLREK